MFLLIKNKIKYYKIIRIENKIKYYKITREHGTESCQKSSILYININEN